jgi:hypothetical protein
MGRIGLDSLKRLGEGLVVEKVVAVGRLLYNIITLTFLVFTKSSSYKLIVYS